MADHDRETLVHLTWATNILSGLYADTRQEELQKLSRRATNVTAGMGMDDEYETAWAATEARSDDDGASSQDDESDHSAWSDGIDEEPDDGGTRTSSFHDINAKAFQELIVVKYLNVLAQLISHERGWAGVVATALRSDGGRGFDVLGFDVLIAKNEKFNKEERDMMEDLREGMRVPDSSDFLVLEEKVLNYHRARVQSWLGKFHQAAGSLRGHSYQCFKFEMLLDTASRYAERGEVLSGRDLKAVSRGADVALRSPEKLPRPAREKGKIRTCLEFLARPVRDLETYLRILFEFRRQCPLIKFTLVEAPDPFRMAPSERRLVGEAWRILVDSYGGDDQTWSNPLPSGLQQLPPDIPPSVETSCKDFGKSCQMEHGIHAEVQILATVRPSQLVANYIGCSKRPCLLCHGFFQALHPAVRARPTHGVCYPRWSVPLDGAHEPERLRRPLRNLIASIMTQIRLKLYDVPIVRQNTPQSGVVSPLPLRRSG